MFCELVVAIRSGPNKRLASSHRVLSDETQVPNQAFGTPANHLLLRHLYRGCPRACSLPSQKQMQWIGVVAARELNRQPKRYAWGRGHGTG